MTEPSATADVPAPPTKRARRPARAASATEAVLSQYQRFTIARVNRSQLKNAPYNPRVLTEKAKTRLRALLKKHGLVEPLVWNKRTGHLVGGHQRIARLDSLESSSDYLLDVAQIDVDEKTEKELNVALNNVEAQGTWDFAKLESLYRNDNLDAAGMGFDQADIFRMFGSDPLMEKASEIQAFADKLRAAQEAFEAKVAHTDEKNDIDFFLVVKSSSFDFLAVFKSHADRKRFTDTLGLADNTYIDAQWLTLAIRRDAGLELEKTEMPEEESANMKGAAP